MAYGITQQTDISDLAARYAFGISTLHPFFDGNKRTACASCVLFRRLNRRRPTRAGPAIQQSMNDLDVGRVGEDWFAQRLRGG